LRNFKEKDAERARAFERENGSESTTNTKIQSPEEKEVDALTQRLYEVVFQLCGEVKKLRDEKDKATKEINFLSSDYNEVALSRQIAALNNSHNEKINDNFEYVQYGEGESNEELILAKGPLEGEQGVMFAIKTALHAIQTASETRSHLVSLISTLSSLKSANDNFQKELKEKERKLAQSAPVSVPTKKSKSFMNLRQQEKSSFPIDMLLKFTFALMAFSVMFFARR
jgi:flagellin-like hook-associated protein FlgL